MMNPPSPLSPHGHFFFFLPERGNHNAAMDTQTQKKNDNHETEAGQWPAFLFNRKEGKLIFSLQKGWGLGVLADWLIFFMLCYIFFFSRLEIQCFLYERVAIIIIILFLSFSLSLSLALNLIESLSPPLSIDYSFRSQGQREQQEHLSLRKQWKKKKKGGSLDFWMRRLLLLASFLLAYSLNHEGGRERGNADWLLSIKIDNKPIYLSMGEGERSKPGINMNHKCVRVCVLQVP